MNQTKSNIPKEKENASKKEIEVITIEDSEDSDISLPVKSRKKKKRKYIICRMKNFHLKNGVKIKKQKNKKLSQL